MDGEDLPDHDAGGPDLQRPNIARVYDYMLGGSHNFAVDREFAVRMQERLPGVAGTYANNRSFLRRVVRYCVRRGVDQFLDLGAGIPTVGNVHEVAREVRPGARVAYVDIEPVVIAHSEQFLSGVDGVTVTRADLRDPRSVLSAPGVRDLLDLDRPVAVLMMASLHFVPLGEDLAGIVDGYRSPVAPGSLVAISHASADLSDPADRAAMRAGEVLHRETSMPLHLRDRAELAPLMTGLDLVEPGVVEMRDWRREPGQPQSLGAGENIVMMGLVR